MTSFSTLNNLSTVQELFEETEDNARKMMQELKLNEEGIQDEARQRAEADRETAAAR